MTTPTFPARVNEQGRLQFTEGARRALDMWLGTLVGSMVEITVKRKRSTRSSRQNRYYFGVVVRLLGEHCGYDPDDMHETLAMKFLRIEDCPVTGAPRRKRTPKCDTKEFAEYLDACIRLAAELGVVIPEPNEVSDAA